MRESKIPINTIFFAEFRVNGCTTPMISLVMAVVDVTRLQPKPAGQFVWQASVSNGHKSWNKGDRCRSLHIVHNISYRSATTPGSTRETFQITMKPDGGRRTNIFTVTHNLFMQENDKTLVNLRKAWVTTVTIWKRQNLQKPTIAELNLTT